MNLPVLFVGKKDWLVLQPGSTVILVLIKNETKKIIIEEAEVIIARNMERVSRTGDENVYQPKIHSDRIRSLYHLKEITGLPLTVLVDLAIGEFLEIYEKKFAEGQGEYGKTNRKD